MPEDQEKMRTKDKLWYALAKSVLKDELNIKALSLKNLIEFYLDLRQKVPEAVQCVIKIDRNQDGGFLVTQLMLDEAGDLIPGRQGMSWGRQLKAQSIDGDVYEYMAGENPKIMRMEKWA